MTGEEFKAIRRELGLSAKAFGAALGYTGVKNTISVQIRRYESGERPIPPWIERLAVMYGRHGIPSEWQ